MNRTMSKLVPPTTIERYFSLHYGRSLASHVSARGSGVAPVDKDCLGEDTCIARHHNGICLICLSPRHPIVRLAKTVSKVDYRVEIKEVKGKRKKGGIAVEERTKLCHLTCGSGEVYAVQCTVKGTLAEYNTALEDKPNLVMEKPLTNGYLAVVLPWPSKIKTAVDHLVPEDEYENSWEASGHR